MKTVVLRRTASRVGLVVAALAISGCSNLFTGNLFSNFDGPPSASEILSSYVDDDGNVDPAAADGFVSALGDAADSNKFYDDLSDDDRADLTASLSTVYKSTDPAVTPETKQKAALLAADVTLKGTDSGDTINNVANVLTSDAGVDSFSDAGDLLNQIIPDEAQGDPVAIKKILDDMVAAADAYDALGSSLTDADGDGTPDSPDGVNMTEVSQKAAVAMVVRNLVTQDGGDGETLANAVADGTVETLTFTDPLSAENADGSALNNILKAGGLDGLFEGDA